MAQYEAVGTNKGKTPGAGRHLCHVSVVCVAGCDLRVKGKAAVEVSSWFLEVFLPL